MVVWEPEIQRARIRNGKVTAVGSTGMYASVRIDGVVINNVPVYGPVAVGEGVLVAEQGGGLLVLSDGSPKGLVGYCETATVTQNVVSPVPLQSVWWSNCLGLLSWPVNGNVITLTVGGWWQVNAMFKFPHGPNALNHRSFFNIRKIQNDRSWRGAVPLYEETGSVSGVWYFAPGEQLHIQAYQNHYAAAGYWCNATVSIAYLGAGGSPVPQAVTLPEIPAMPEVDSPYDVEVL